MEGQLLLQAAPLPDRPVGLCFDALRSGKAVWHLELQAAAQGLSVQADGSYDPAGDRLDFRLSECSLDLHHWEEYLQQMVLLPGGPWQLAGLAGGTAEGHFHGHHRVMEGHLTLTGGRLSQPAGPVSLERISATLDFDDLLRLHSRPAHLRIGEVRSGGVVFNELELNLALEAEGRWAVSGVSLQAFGGRLTAEPFNVYPAQQELEAVLVAEGLDLARLLAATHDVPAHATGRVDGRLPLRLDAGGLRLGAGWLQLPAGTQAEIRLHASGRLSGAAAPGSAGLVTRRKIESGLLALRLTELRLELRPPDAPAGVAARLHLAGTPAESPSGPPIVLDLALPVPVEHFLHLGSSAPH